MKGFRFVIDDSEKKKAVIIDLEEWGEFWEDIYDVMVARSRKDEPLCQWEELRAEMGNRKKVID
jgi:hypothetical protein